MRLRSTALLSTLAVTGIALVGCSGEPAPESSPSASAAGDLCGAAVGSGAASEAVTVEGEPGEASTATFEKPLEITELQSTVVAEGEGEPIEAGQLIEYAMSAYDATTGEELGVIGYEEGQLLPQQITPESVFAQILGCATVGTRVVSTFPASQGQDGSEVPGQVYVFDLTGVTPSAAWGDPQEPVEGEPTVGLADDGEPTITLPDAEAPSETQVSELKVGDGDTVESGDQVLVQYTGVKWSDGSVFDSSWVNGAPTAFVTNQVVPGFTKALEGQTVGSQVLVTMPPADGYGSSEGHELQDETLTFVVDILATQHPAPAQ
ncbi:peptidylprolyl isomerase [Microbacterium sp. Root53]|uniref:FKBP-type peptidyl-prolyl cis-trans isomerase n=1 Tax=Microbacterium sp. Root53 TaxID=1736553 RepID=UPI0006F4FBFE|nr:FKBP-type peptidyl-prolyl cis-trans isomerase [Microbacterium sp. Root53]KQY97008.1 peptidylprolyl isomerase [Microbacterium sp. Root53]